MPAPLSLSGNRHPLEIVVHRKRKLGQRPRFVRGERRHAAGLGVSQVIVVNLVLALVLAEGTLVVWARVHPSVLFMDQASAERRLEANRNPGHVYFGYPFNSGGYHDEPSCITSLKSLEMNTQTALIPSVLNAQKQ